MYKNRKDVGGYQNAVHSRVIAELNGNMFHASAQLGFRLSLKLETSSSWMFKNRKDIHMQYTRESLAEPNGNMFHSNNQCVCPTHVFYCQQVPDILNNGENCFLPISYCFQMLISASTIFDKCI